MSVSTDDVSVATSLVKGLSHSSPGTQMHCFSALTTLLQIDGHLETQQLIQIVNDVLTTDVRNSKGEKRLVYAGKVLALGVLVRSGRVSLVDVELLTEVFAELVLQAKKKLSLLVLATPFICKLLQSELPTESTELVASLLAKYSKMNPALLKIALTAQRYQPDFTSAVLVNPEVMGLVILNKKNLDDLDYFELLFSYLISTEQIETFWTQLIPKFNASHVQLICTLIETSAQKEITHKYFIRPEIVTILLAMFRKENKTIVCKVKRAFHHLLQWRTIKSATEREHGIAVLFSGTPNVMHEYKFLVASLRQFLTFLNSKELDQLVGLCSPQLEHEHRGRHTVSNISFLTRIAQLKSTNLKTKTEVMKLLFELGFCTTTSHQFETAIQKSRDAFRATLRFTFEETVVSELFRSVGDIVCGDDIKNSLAVKMPQENLALWVKLRDLSRSIGDPELRMCIQLHAFLLILDPLTATAALEKIISGIPNVREINSDLKICTFLMSIVVSALLDDKSILHYELLFTRLLKKEMLRLENVQLLVDAINSEITLNDVPFNDEDSTSSDDSEIEDDCGAYAIESAKASKNNSSTVLHRTIDSNSDEESSIDMDDVSEADLDRMDLTLSQTFAMKKSAENRNDSFRNLLRLFHLVELILKRCKDLDAGIPLIMVMPCLTSLIKCSKTTRGAPSLPRILSVVKRLNSIKKLTRVDDVDISIINGILEDIKKLLAKKLRKDVRRILKGSIDMLIRCFLSQVKLE